MPELPEVQTIVDDLKRTIKGTKIIDFWTEAPKALNMPVAKFKKNILTKKIKAISRQGKHILITLEDDNLIAIHLKMTGHLLLKKLGKEKTGHFAERVNQYIRHSWKLKTKNAKTKINSKASFDMLMDFSDLRKFARIAYGTSKQIQKERGLDKLGIDPSIKEFSFKKFNEILEDVFGWDVRRLLMEQTKIAGVGNIYASEILFEAALLPTRKIAELSLTERKLFYNSIKKILAKAIKMRGTSDSDYRDASGAKGGFQDILKVYNRERQPCKRKNCQGTVQREKIKQRSAYWCQVCQK